VQRFSVHSIVLLRCCYCYS